MSAKPLLPMISFIEFFERFGFYTMQGILVLFLMKTKHYSSTDAYHIYGAFFALVYAFVGFGGWCGDKFLGPKNTLLFGLLVMGLGYLGLSLGSDANFFPALAAVCIGNALFKANPANLLGKYYAAKPEKLHAAFTWFYMAINVGSLFALIVGPYLSSKFNYSYAFAASTLGIFIAFIYAILNAKDLEVGQEMKSTNIWQWLVVILVSISLWLLATHLIAYYDLVSNVMRILLFGVVILYLILMQRETAQARRRLFAVLILMLEAVVFFTLYNQMPTSINMYAVLHVNAEFFGHHFDSQSFQALNPFWITVFSPILAYLYQRHKWSIFGKFATGMFSCGLSYLVLYCSHFFVDTNLHISGLWLVGSYVFQSLGELLVSALGLAMVAELVPSTWMGVVMGMWFLTSAVSGFTGAQLASLVQVPKDIEASVSSLAAFAHLFVEIALVILLIAGIMGLSIRWMQRLIR